MFTGLVEVLGAVRDLVSDGVGRRLTVAAPEIAAQLTLGESVAVNGSCLTVVAHDAETCCFQLSPETLQRTNLGALRLGDRVNLERSLRLSDRLGGHLVQGHVDGVGQVAERRTEGEWVTMWFSCPPDLAAQMVSKGSVTVDGVSLTMVDVGADRFSVALIPHTLAHTTLGFKQPGDAVNLETDLIGKYVGRYLNPTNPQRVACRPSPLRILMYNRKPPRYNRDIYHPNNRLARLRPSGYVAKPTRQVRYRRTTPMARFMACAACACILMTCGSGAAQQSRTSRPKAPECYSAALHHLARGDYGEAYAAVRQADTLRPKHKPYEQLLASLEPIAKRNKLRTYALAAGKDDESSVEQLAQYLKKGAEDEESRAWLLYCWLTDRIAYDVKSFLSGEYTKKDYNPAAVLKERQAVCARVQQSLHRYREGDGARCSLDPRPRQRVSGGQLQPR